VSHRNRLPDWGERLKLLVITERVKELGRDHLDVAEAALHGGCRAIQFRDKEIADRAFVEAARGIQERCLLHGALFFVNDRVDVAAVLDCGVHLGLTWRPSWTAVSTWGSTTSTWGWLGMSWGRE